MVILNSLQASRDLLDKRSSIYSDRPRFVLLAELCVTSYFFTITAEEIGFLVWGGKLHLLTWDSKLCPLSPQIIHHVDYSGPRFRKHRRFINQTFNQRALSTFRPLQEKEVLVLLEGMLQNPDAFVDHFRRCVSWCRDRQSHSWSLKGTRPPQFSKSPMVMT
jgi:hypothetical protein